MNKRGVADALEEAATLLELSGENPFRVRAYRNASRLVRSFSADLTEAVADGSIRDIKGIGPNISEHIAQLLVSEEPAFLAELRSRLPDGVMEMLRIPGLGPKRIRMLMEELGVQSIGELEYACRENRLLDLDGFGVRSQENIIKGIEKLSAYAGRYLAHNVQGEADQIISTLRGIRGAGRVSAAGSLRRKKEIVKDMDILASGEADVLMDAAASQPLVDEIISRGSNKLTARLVSGVNLDLRVIPDESFPYALQHFTGSRDHNIELREIAISMGMKSNEYGLFKAGENIPCADEEEIYANLGLPYIPPELREATGEIEAAREGKIPRLIESGDIMGTLHLHTVASDGSATAMEMVEAARKLGFSYMGVTEHSRSARYARGLETERIKREAELIDRLNDSMDDFTILKGIESDILPDGSLDYPDDVLATFDFVIGSVHSAFSMPEEQMTRRICLALENPYLDVLGHPTGRLLLTREPYAVDMEEVLACTAKFGKAVELNAHPYRMDLDWRLMPRAKSLGIRIAICPDAHDTGDLEYTIAGVSTARKGWLTREDVLNCLSAEELIAYFRARRGGR